MRQQRHFMAQVRSDDEHPLERFHVGDLQTEIRIGRLALLAAKIQLAQAMIDVVAAEAARDLREQVKFFHGGHRRGQKS